MNLTLRPALINPATISGSPFIQALFASRLTSPDQLHLHWQRLLPPTLLDMEQALERIETALDRRQSIVIYGDYDVDGASATALLYQVLRGLGARVDYFLPQRQQEGYGFNCRGLDSLRQRFRPDLIITVDNGIKSREAAALLPALNIDLIITDHHLAEAELPLAAAVINPNRRDERFPSKNLAGVGVAFYLAWALRERRGAAFKVSDFLHLVALGTLADLVPLDFNNRILVSYGLRQLRSGVNLGLNALMEISRLAPGQLSCQDIAFSLAPRLNAAGRLAHMGEAVQLLLSRDYGQALTLARRLDDYNRRRKELEKQILDEIKEPEGPLLCAYGPHWPEGVIGIVAARLKSAYGRPALVACNSQEGWIKGSMRAPAAVSVKALLEAGAAALPAEALIYGGHWGAGGFSVRQEYFARFCAALTEAVPDYGPELLYHDGPLPPEAFNLETVDYFSGQVWGSGFPSPLFCNEFLLSDYKKLSGGHCSFSAQLPGGPRLRAVAFGQDFNPLPPRALLAFELADNPFQGQRQLQLLVRHLYNS